MRNRNYTAGVLLALVATGAFGCGPSQEAEESTMQEVDRATVSASESMREELAAFRTEVGSALSQIRHELMTLQEDMAAGSREELTELSDSAAQATSDLMSDLQRLDYATAEQARAIQRAATTRLADLEGQVAEGQVAASKDADELAKVVDEQLEHLESDLDNMDQSVMSQPPTDDRGARPEGELQIARLRHQIDNVRSEAVEIDGDITPAELELRRVELGDAIAELTREVRREWYTLRWELDAA